MRELQLSRGLGVVDVCCFGPFILRSSEPFFGGEYLIHTIYETSHIMKS